MFERMARWIGEVEARKYGLLDSLVDDQGRERGNVWRGSGEYGIGWTHYGPEATPGGKARTIEAARAIVESAAVSFAADHCCRLVVIK